MKSLKTLFQIREIYIGIAAAIAFQLIFFSVWMTAYDGVNDRVTNLSIGIVYEDDSFDQSFQEKIPFETATYQSVEHAKSAMNERKIDMVIQIPQDFTESIVTGDKAQIHYFINQANGTLAKSTMENVASKLSAQLNEEIYSLQINAFKNEFSDVIEESVLLMLDALMDAPVEETIIKTNDVEGFAANLIPLMVIISSFVGAMVMIMQIEAAAQSVKTIVSKWSLFFARQIINLGVAFLLPLLTIGLMSIFDITSDLSFITIYLFQFMMFWAFLSFAQIFVLLFGNAGMVFNILALSLQLVTSGVLVPRIMLSDWYFKIGTFLPATYGADGYYTIIFGGTDASIVDNSLTLLVVIAVTLCISLLTIWIKKERTTIE